MHLSASTLSNICRRKYSLPVDVIKKKLPSRNQVALDLNGWTSTNKLAIVLVIAYCTDHNWGHCKVQLGLGEIDWHILLYFDS
jgi:hypothetical protein